MSVFPADFPQLWQKPPFEVLLACLRELQVELPVWNSSTSRKAILKYHGNTAHVRREVASYLSGIIKSSLVWIEDDDEKEALWNEASRRLAERCGRAGMGEIIRRWPFENSAYPAFELIIREPPMIGDSLGLKTWGSSYVLAQLLGDISSRSLLHLLPDSDSGPYVDVLELGSGTGLLGLAAAAIWKCRVFLTDLPTIMPNLSFNVEANRTMIESRGGSVDASALTWGGSAEDNGKLTAKRDRFKIVLVADPLYNDDHPSLLSSAIEDHLMEDCSSRVVVMVPLRDATTKKLLSNLISILAQERRPLKCLEEHLEAGQDDWDEDDDAAHVECWWGVFGRS